MRRTPAVLLTAALLAAALVGCSDDKPDPAPSTSRPPATTRPPLTPTPSDPASSAPAEPTPSPSASQEPSFTPTQPDGV